MEDTIMEPDKVQVVTTAALQPETALTTEGGVDPGAALPTEGVLPFQYVLRKLILAKKTALVKDNRVTKMDKVVFYKKPYHEVLIQLFQETPKQVNAPKHTTLYKKFINNKTDFCTKYSLDKTDETSIYMMLFLEHCHDVDTARELLHIVDDYYKIRHYKASKAHNICHTKIVSKGFFVSACAFINKCMDKLLAKEAVAQKTKSDNSHRSKIYRKISGTYFLFIVIAIIDQVGLFPIMEGLEWTLTGKETEVPVQYDTLRFLMHCIEDEVQYKYFSTHILEQAKQLCLESNTIRKDNRVIKCPKFPISYLEFREQNFHETITKWFRDMSATKCAKDFFSPLIYPNRSIDCAIGGNMTQPSKERDTNTSIYDATSGNNKIPSEEVHINTSINAPNSGSMTLKKKEKANSQSKKGTARKRVHETSSNGDHQSVHKKRCSSISRNVLSASSNVVEQQPEREVCDDKKKLVNGKDSHHYLFSNYAMQNEKARYEMYHSSEFRQDSNVRKQIQTNGCVDCSKERTIFIDACVILDDIQEKQSYYYCKEHATKWFLTYAKTGNIVLLNTMMDLPTYYHYYELRNNTYPEKYSKLHCPVSVNNCNLNYQNNVECREVCGAAKCTNNFVRQFRNEEETTTKCYASIVSEKLGVGVFSSKTIGKDETIIEINGEVLDFPTIQSDVQQKLRVNDNYLYIHQLDENHWIDAEYEGNISRYINHSCKPNAKLKKWTVRSFVGTVIYIYIYIYIYLFFSFLKEKNTYVLFSLMLNIALG